jgi:PEP-CTERM motif
MRINRRLLCLVTSLFLVAPSSAEVIFSLENHGVVLPAASCPPPPALPLGCDLTALGTATSTSDPTLGPWDFLSVFQVGAPLSMTTFATAGTFSFNDTSAANNDFFGIFTGVFDAATFQATNSSTVTGGTGLFSSGHGFGTEFVSIFPSMSGPPTYIAPGEYRIPEPSSIVLLGLGLLALVRIRLARP